MNARHIKPFVRHALALPAQGGTVLRAGAVLRHYSEGKENIEEFSRNWIEFFKAVPDAFELQRGLNQAFSDDLVPPAPVLEEAMRACRRHDAFATAVKILVAVRAKILNKEQYEQYAEHLKPLMDELGVCRPEEINR